MRLEFRNAKNRWCQIIAATVSFSTFTYVAHAEDITFAVHFLYAKDTLPVRGATVQVFEVYPENELEQREQAVNCPRCGTDGNGWFMQVLDIKSRHVRLALEDIQSLALFDAGVTAIAVPDDGEVEEEFMVVRLASTVDENFGREVLELVLEVAAQQDKAPSDVLLVMWEEFDEIAYPASARVSIAKALHNSVYEGKIWDKALADTRLSQYAAADFEMVQQLETRIESIGFAFADVAEIARLQIPGGDDQLNGAVIAADLLWGNAVTKSTREEAATTLTNSIETVKKTERPQVEASAEEHVLPLGWTSKVIVELLSRPQGELLLGVSGRNDKDYQAYVGPCGRDLLSIDSDIPCVPQTRWDGEG